MQGPGTSRRSSVLVAAAVAAAVVLLSVFVSFDLRWRTQQSLDQRNEGAWSTLVVSLDEAVDAYEDALFASTAYFATEGDPGPVKFREFVTSLRLAERRPGFQVYGHATWVPVDRLTEYEQLRQDLLDAAGIRDLTFDVHPDPEPGADGALAIDSVFPLDGNEAAVGLDFLSEGNRRAAALATRDSGMAVATGPITLVQETGDQRAFLVMLAQYAPGAPTATVDDRRDAFIGVSYAGFRMGDLMSSVTGTRTPGDVTIYDIGAVGEPELGLTDDRLTFASDPTRPAVSPDGVRAGTVEIAGRQWWIALESQSAGAIERRAPWVVLAAGVLIGLLSGLLLERLFGSRRRAVAIAHRMTEELRRREADLERSNTELERFAFVASHDLREPLRTITNYIGLAQLADDGALGPEIRRYLDVAARGAERMSLLVTDLLEFSQIGRERHDDAVDMASVWAEVETNLESARHAAGAELRAGRLPVVEGDRRGLVQVLQNLVANAIKYRGEEPPVIVCTARQVGDRVEIRVSDNGIGIAPEYHETVFGMFKRLHTRDEYEGTGMGLAIARRIIESYGGTIVVEPTEGPGTTFLIELAAASTAPTGSDIRNDRAVNA